MRSFPPLAAALALAGPLSGAGGDPVPPISGAARWGAEYFPNVELVTHEGRSVRFFDDLIADKVVLVNFIYTSCPDACPLETAKLTEVYQLLGGRVGEDVFFYSISIDPERDTPAVLQEYAERYEVGPGWLFLTGAAADIKLVRQKLGMLRTGEEALSEHTMSLLIGNQATGKWMKRSPMENPYLLATQIGSWLHDWKNPPEPGHDYSDAPELRSVSRGESLFRTRCATCHLIGPEDGIRRQGPNLLGVTERRERAWLARWLAEPDAMLAEGDPIALELFAAYRNLPMPNMRLNALEVDAVIAFMEEESAWYTGDEAGADDGDFAPAEREGADVAAEPEVPACCRKDDGLVFGDDPDGSAEEPAPMMRLVLDAPPVPRRAPAAPVRARNAWPLGSLLLCAGLGLVLAGFGAVLGRRSE